MDATTINRNDPEGNRMTLPKHNRNVRALNMIHSDVPVCSSDKEILINVHVAPFR